jgi:hypothetical protein
MTTRHPIPISQHPWSPRLQRLLQDLVQPFISQLSDKEVDDRQGPVDDDQRRIGREEEEWGECQECQRSRDEVRGVVCVGQVVSFSV